MRISTRAMVALLATAAAAPAFAQYGSSAPPAQPQQPVQSANDQSQTPGVRPSKQALKAIADLQAAANSNDLAAVRAKAAAAKAVAATKEDRYLIGQLQLKAGVTGKDHALASTGLDAIAASGFLETGKVAQLYSTIGVSAYNAKQFEQAATLFQKGIALNPRDTEALGFLGETQLAQGQKAQALATFQRAIQVAASTGAKPEEALYKRAVAVAFEARIPAAAELARQWVLAYPSSESWRGAIGVYQGTLKTDVEGTMDLLRLMRAAGALTTPAYLAAYVNTLTEQSNFIEAQNALDEAIAARKVDPSNAQIQNLVASLKGRPRVTEAELTAAAKTVQSGMALLRIGDRFYGLGNYAKAAETYRQAMVKGADKSLANIRIGIALAGAGDKAGATAAFNAVSGPRSDIAKFWLLYLQSRA